MQFLVNCFVQSKKLANNSMNPVITLHDRLVNHYIFSIKNDYLVTL